MADFCQSPEIATIHNLRQMSDEEMVRQTACLANSLSMQQASALAVVIPVRFGDFGQPALQRILHLLQHGQLADRVILVLNGASADDYRRALSGAAFCDGKVEILWAESPHLHTLNCLMETRMGKGIGGGKGAACWLAAGYAATCPGLQVLAFQDADVESYSPAMTARLCKPLLDRSNGMDFAKGYYARTGDRLYGRVTRQFLYPFLQAAQTLFPESGYIRLLRALRYLLSGEVALSAELLREMPFHTGWSLELGMLWSIHRANLAPRSCQVEIADDYRHRHHPVESADLRKQSLRRMATGLAVSLFRLLEQEGHSVTSWHHNAFLAKFEHFAEKLHLAYRMDAKHNDLDWDEEAESAARRTFLESVRAAMTSPYEAGAADTTLPAWKSVLQAVPEAEDLLRAATAKPNRRAATPSARVSQAPQDEHEGLLNLFHQTTARGLEL